MHQALSLISLNSTLNPVRGLLLDSLTFQMRKLKEKIRNSIKVTQPARSNDVKVRKRPSQSKEDF